MPISNKIAVWGSTIDDYGSSAFPISGGNTPGLKAGNLAYAQDINKAFRNATIVDYAIADMLTGISWPTQFNIGFDVEPSQVSAFATEFRSAFNSYIKGVGANYAQSAGTAETAASFTTSRRIRLLGDVTGLQDSTGVTGWDIYASIGKSKVLGSMISDGEITSSKLSTSAVTTSKISANAVTAAKIDVGAVTTDKIASWAITDNKIAGGAIKTNHIANNAVETNKIANAAVTNAKIANPWIDFTNGGLSQRGTLGSSLALGPLFGFSETGLVQYASSTSAFSIFPEDAEYIKAVPNYFMISVSQYINANFPIASIVGHCAFAYTNVSEVSLPKAKYLYGAFYNCESLISITLGSEMETICQGLLPCHSYGSNSRILFSQPAGCFAQCTNLTYVDLGGTKSIINDIGNIYYGESVYGAFYNCSNLISVYGSELEYIGPSVISMSSYSGNEGYNTFAMCSNLTTIDFPKLKFIGPQTFTQCYKLNYSGQSTITHIASGAFYGCSSLTYLSFPNLISCGDRFSRCPNLSFLNLGRTESLDFGSSLNTTYHGQYFFKTIIASEAKYFRAFVSSNTWEDRNVFPDLEELIIDNVESLCLATFASKLSKLTSDGNNILSKVTYFAGNFCSCSNLSKLELPNLITWSNPWRAFDGTGIKSFKIPSTFDSSIINQTFFRNASNFESLYIGVTDKVLWLEYASEAFFGTKITSSTGSIFVKTDALRTQYQQHSTWSIYANRIFVSDF